MKPVVWLGSSKKDLLSLPEAVVDTFGYALYLAQVGKRHAGSKILQGQGDASVVEVVESRQGSTYRAVYTLRYPAAVFVLHVFQKKSRTGIGLSRADARLIHRRMQDAGRLAEELKP